MVILAYDKFQQSAGNDYNPSPGFVFAIGDIHGHAEELAIVLRKIRKYMQKYPDHPFQIVTLGDYFNRGPDAKGVADALVSLKNNLPDDAELITIKGNNDAVLLDFITEDDPAICYARYTNLVRKGMLQTLASYGWFRFPDVLMPTEAEALSARNYLRNIMPDEHLEFLKNLQISHTLHATGGNLFFCHGGVDVSKVLEEQDEEILQGIDKKTSDGVRISKQFSRTSGKCLQDKRGEEYIVVHGHSIIGRHPQVTESRYSVDTGCYKKGGQLSCLVIANGTAVDVLTCSNLFVAFSKKAMVTPETFPPRKTVKGWLWTQFYERLKNSPFALSL